MATRPLAEHLRQVEFGIGKRCTRRRDMRSKINYPIGDKVSGGTLNGGQVEELKSLAVPIDLASSL